MKNVDVARLSIKLKPSGFSLFLESEDEYGFSVSFFAIGSRAYQLSSSVEGYFSEGVIDVHLPFSPLRVGITSLELRPFAGRARKATAKKKSAGREVHLRYGTPLQMLPIYTGKGKGKGRGSGYSGYSAYSSYSSYSAYSRYSRGAGRLDILPPVKMGRLGRKQESNVQKRVRKSRKTKSARKKRNDSHK
jgi:hypothetical protein